MPCTNSHPSQDAAALGFCLQLYCVLVQVPHDVAAVNLFAQSLRPWLHRVAVTAYAYGGPRLVVALWP